MGLVSDLRILYHMALRSNRGNSHAERMENFYSGQASDYDGFRKKLLQGRQELWSALDVPRENLVWVDLGGGTGSNLEYFGGEVGLLQRVYVVDLAESLLKVAADRAKQANWSNVETVAADATKFRPEEPVDVVTFSYSLTMIPDWMAALDNALAMLKPGGRVGIVDFYVGRKHPSDGLAKHGWLTRHGWPAWFATDNVFLSPDHVPRLHSLFDVERFEEHRAKVPYLPFFRVPYYIFIGRKKSCTD